MAAAFDRRTLVGGAAVVLALGPIAMVARAKPKPRVIKVVARKFNFVPGEIRVRLGEMITFALTAPEVPMGFSIPDFGVRTDVVPGKVATLSLVPDKSGSFTFLCDVFCGSGHEDMSGTLVVSA
jgi:cytochrome c oxidase subunit 2